MMKKILTLVFGVFITTLSFASEEPTFAQKIRQVSPGMNQTQVIAVLGQPEAVVNKFVAQDGRLIEVWRYFASNVLNVPSEGVFTVATGPVPAEVVVPRSEPNRVEKDAEFWGGVQNAATTNPADPFYKPALHKLPAPSVVPAAATSRVQGYLITFADGVVQNVVLSEQDLQ